MTSLKTNQKLLSILNIAAFLLVVAVNVIANTLPLNGRTAGEISDALPSYFTPAGYTFSIWSVIYLSLLGFVIYQALPAKRKRPFQNQIGWLFIANCLANCAWIFAWHYGFFILSVGIMITILLTLVAIYARLGVGLPNGEISLTERLFVHVPFSLYLGWISVATIANSASVLAYLGWNGFGIAEPVWAAIMIFIAVIVAGMLLVNRNDFVYAGVLVWALFGIRTAQSSEPLITTATVVAAVLIVALAFVGFYRTRYSDGSMSPKLA